MAGTPTEGIVAFSGEDGSLSSIAAKAYFSHVDGLKMESAGNIQGCFRDVSRGRALYAVVPIENSSSGTLVNTYDLLLEYDVVMCGELGVPEIYCLCAHRGINEAAIRKVLSHPNILESCSTYITTRLHDGKGGPVERVATTDTTAAARAATDTMAAICTKESAAKNGLAVVAENIGNDRHMETRYAVIKLRATNIEGEHHAPFPVHVPGSVLKSSAVFLLKNEASAIFKLLSCWSLRNINITKLETRPVPSGREQGLKLPDRTASLWHYFFYLEWELPNPFTADAKKRLWDACVEFSLWQRDLGTYQSHVTRSEKLPMMAWEDQVDLMTKA